MTYTIYYQGEPFATCHNSMVIYKIRSLLKFEMCPDYPFGADPFGINKEHGLYYSGGGIDTLKLAMVLADIEIRAFKGEDHRCEGFDKIVIPVFHDNWDHGFLRFRVIPKYAARKRGVLC